jgi:hypothetical protein
MEVFALDEVPLKRLPSGRPFPFELGGQTRSGPVRISVGFEITDVRHRLRFIDRPEAAESEAPPIIVATFPIERGVPTLFVHGHPSER